MGGFDEVNLKVAFNDVDYCLRLRSAGYRIVYNPFSVLYHFESKSRGFDVSEAKQARHRAEAATFRRRWSDIVDADPFITRTSSGSRARSIACGLRREPGT